MTALTRAIPALHRLSLPLEFRSWAWCAVFAAALFTFVGIAVATVVIPYPVAFYAYNHPRIAAFAPAGGNGSGKKRVIMLGNSQLKYGTELPDDRPSPARQSAWDKVEMLRLVYNLGVFQDFRPLLDEVLAARPDVIVVQLPLVAVERRIPYARLLALRDYMKWLAFGIGPWSPDELTQAEQQYGKPCSGDRSTRELENRVARYKKITHIDLTGPNATAARQFIAAATARGIRVVLIAIPATSGMDAVIPMWNAAVVEDVLSHFATDPGVTVARYPDAIPDEMFCDSLHLGAAGRARFSDWLATLIQ